MVCFVEIVMDCLKQFLLDKTWFFVYTKKRAPAAVRHGNNLPYTNYQRKNEVISLQNLNAPLRCFSIYPTPPRLVHCPTGWTGNAIPRNNYFFYVLEGGFVLNIENNSYFVRKNQLAFLPAGKHHTFWLLADKNLTMLDFSFSSLCDDGEDIFAFYGCTEEHHVVSLPEKDVMDIYTAASSPLPPQLDAFKRTITCAELTRLCALYLRARINHETSKKEFAVVTEYMQDHLADDIPLETLASLMHLDTTYFSAKFKKETGVPPMKHLAQLRAKEAARLLRYTDKSISAIAKAIGFENIYSFKNFFLKHMGVRPELYKEIFINPPYLTPFRDNR